MTKQLRVRSIKRKEVDEEKLALAYLLLAKILYEREQAEETSDQQSSPPAEEAA